MKAKLFVEKKNKHYLIDLVKIRAQSQTKGPVASNVKRTLYPFITI